MEYYEVAAKWWADQLREKPKETPEDMNDFTEEDFESYYMKSFQKIELGDTPERIDEFQKILTRLIKEGVEEEGELVISMDYRVSMIFGHQSISTVYMPGSFLGDALQRAKIEWSNIPLRRMMWVSPKEVNVTYGRGKPKIKIFTGATT